MVPVLSAGAIAGVPVVPVLIICLAGAAVVASNNRKKKIVGMTPKRQDLYEALLQNQKDPNKLRTMAAHFEGEGLEEQATVLRKLACILELPKEKKDARRAIFRKAMASKNRPAVENVAAVFEKEGCIGAAAALRKYAEGLPPQMAEAA